mgnify:CR=1 FL=1
MKLLCIAFLTSWSLFASAAQSFNASNPATIYMVVWRGCEDACRGFKNYIENNDLPVNLIIRDVARDKGRIAQYLNEAKQLKPDLVVTWGTTVSKGIIGTMGEYGSQTKLGDIPVMFMIVADPLGAGIVSSYQASGRETVTGIRNRVSEDVQIRAIREYFPLLKMGVVYSKSELNSVLNTEKLRNLSTEMGFELVVRTYVLDDNKVPLPDQFDGVMAEMAKEKVDVVYVGSSSYNLENRDAFTQAAVRYRLPVASAYDVMVSDSDGLIAVANKYYNVGRLAANQANKVLFENASPGTLPIAELSRFSMFINMDVARSLSLYPPIQLLRFAELINPDSHNED